MITRRTMIKTGLIGTVSLAVLKGIYGPFSNSPTFINQKGHLYQVLDTSDQTILAAIVAVMLEGALPSLPKEKEQVVEEIVQGVDLAIHGLAPHTQKELKELFLLLDFPVTRRLVARVWAPWSQATAKEIHHFLTEWRYSSVSLLNTAYEGLHELIMASYYGNPLSWKSIGYPGPPPIL